MARPRTLSGRPVAVIGHRGYHRTEPENSLAAVAEALAMGVDGVEVDVRMTADGVAVCLHDSYLKRVTGVSGRVARTGMARLLELSLRHPVSGRRRPVATLEEMLTLVEDRVGLVLDLKQESVRPSSLEKEVVRLIRAFGAEENTRVTSFNPWVLRRVKELAPGLRTALIASSRLGVRLYHPDYCDGLHVHHGLMRRRWFARLAPTFRRLAVWTVDRPADIEFPLPDNLDLLITNHPERWGAARTRHRTIRFRQIGEPS